jgi:hypothetical protein
MSPPIRELPPGYRETRHLVVTERRNLILLNLAGLLALGVAFVAMLGWWMLVARWRGAQPGGPEVPWWLGLIVLALVLLVHELVHAAAIALLGHQPRLGAKLDKGVLYATADGALFRRDEFIMIALAPLVVITAVGLWLVVVLPDTLAYWAALAVVFNASGAVGDLWMTGVVFRYPANALVRDEADGIRVYEVTS